MKMLKQEADEFGFGAVFLASPGYIERRLHLENDGGDRKNNGHLRPRVKIR